MCAIGCEELQRSGLDSVPPDCGDDSRATRNPTLNVDELPNISSGCWGGRGTTFMKASQCEVQSSQSFRSEATHMIAFGIIFINSRSFINFWQLFIIYGMRRSSSIQVENFFMPIGTHDQSFLNNSEHSAHLYRLILWYMKFDES